MVRLHVDLELRQGEEIALPPAAAHHVRNVLRLAREADVVVFDGRGTAHEAHLTLVARDAVRALIGAAVPATSESPLELTLVQSISRGERMDYTIQKAVELGVDRIRPVLTRRTVVRLDARREDKRLEHWRGIIRHAAEQSGRVVLPRLEPVQTLSAWLQTRPADSAFVLDPQAAAPLARQPRPPGGVTLVAGPEGGFDARELVQLERAGVVAVSLGPRILRTETAAVCALTVLQTLWGDLA